MRIVTHRRGSGEPKIATRETSGLIAATIRALEARTEISAHLQSANAIGPCDPDVSRLATFYSPLPRRHVYLLFAAIAATPRSEQKFLDFYYERE